MPLRLLSALLLLTPAFAAAQSEPPADAPAEDAEAGAEEAAPSGVLTRYPELVKFVEAEYPTEMEQNDEEGEVVLRLTIGADGRVEEVEIDQSAGPAFDEAALEAVRQFEFVPAQIDGEDAAVQILYRYAFTLEQETEEVAVEVDPERPTGVVSGELLERGTRKPLAGFVVVIEPREGDPVEGITDAEGRFRVEGVPAGGVRVRVDDATYFALADDETVEAGKATEVRYYLERRAYNEADPNEIVVVGRRYRKEVARRTLTLEEIRKIPGTQGDALKVIQTLPGVARVPFGGGALIIRGSNPEDSAAFINRHEVPLAFHFGGFRSVFSSNLIESLEFYPGNFGSEFGRLSGGIVDVRVKRPAEDRLHGYAEADVFDAGFFLEGPLHEGATFAVAGRRSYIDALLPVFLPSDANVDFTVAPRYYDYQALYDYKSGRHRLRAYVYGSDDALTFLLDEPLDTDPALRGEFRNETDFQRLYLAWNADFSEKVSNEVSLTVGRNAFFFVAGENLFFDLEVFVLTAREDVEVRIADNFKLRVGLDGDVRFGDLEIIAPLPPKEGSGANSGARPLGTADLLRRKTDFVIADPAAWIEGELTLGPVLLVPGVRFDYSHPIDDWSVDPRLTARYTLTETTTLKAGVGHYSQRVQPDESDEVFGDPDIDLQHSVHVSAGFEQQFTEALSIDVQGFYKYLYALVSPVESDGLDAFKQTQDRYDNDGKGRIYGMEILAKHQLVKRFFGWVSYTLMRSERQDHPGEDYRLFDFDQTHILTILAQYRLPSNWEIGLRWQYTTGNPRTPSEGGIYDVDADTYVPYQGEVNSERLEDFHQLDVRVDKKWIWDWWTLTAYFELRNLYNRQNVEDYNYNFDFTDREAVTGLPLIPSLGLRGEF